MRILFVLVFLALTAAGAHAQENAPAPAAAAGLSARVEGIKDLADAQDRMERAHLAFERGDSREALELYLAVARSRFANAGVWANAGTAAYRSGDTGRAVLFYSRALKMDPAYDFARNSLAVISPTTNDRDQGFGTELAGALFHRTTPGGWVIAAQIFFLFICLAIAKTLGARDRDARGHWGAILCWSAGLYALCLGVGIANYRFRIGPAGAVVVADKAISRSEPRTGATAQLELPAGTILTLTGDPTRGFVRFQLADGSDGFISTEEIERI